MGGMRWIPLESNPEVMETLARRAGLTDAKYGFHDVYGTEPELLDMVPQPVKAVILLFPSVFGWTERNEEEDGRIAEKGQYPVDPNVIWIKQTISNACGTMAILHSLANISLELEPGSPLAQYFSACKNKSPLERAALLEQSESIAKLHKEVATTGQTEVPPGEQMKVDFHYTCFVQAPSDTGVLRMVELDGERTGPIDRGVSENLLVDATKFIKETYMAHNADNYGFSIVAITPKME